LRVYTTTILRLQLVPVLTAAAPNEVELLLVAGVILISQHTHCRNPACCCCCLIPLPPLSHHLQAKTSPRLRGLAPPPTATAPATTPQPTQLEPAEVAWPTACMSCHPNLRGVSLPLPLLVAAVLLRPHQLSFPSQQPP
jgi:hypothetical protein